MKPTLPADFVLGRAPSCNIVVDDPFVGARHALVRVDTGYNAIISDLGSTNGTRILRHGIELKVVAPTPLLPGDVIIIGRTRIPWRNSGT